MTSRDEVKYMESPSRASAATTHAITVTHMDAQPSRSLGPVGRVPSNFEERGDQVRLVTSSPNFVTGYHFSLGSTGTVADGR